MMPLSKARMKERKKQDRLVAREAQPIKERHIRLPFRIFRRDSFMCQYCGRMPRDGIRLELDHIISQSLGGNGDDANLTTACRECNNAKSNLLIVKPKPLVRYGIEESTGKHVELDADGNIVPEY